MRKNNKIHIPISTEEKNKLKKRAESVGLTLAQYCLFVLMKSRPKIEEDT